MNHAPSDTGRPGRGALANLALMGLLAIGAFFLLTEHRAHLFGYLPFLFLLLCPLMHFGMHGHGGHGGHGGGHAQHGSDETRPGAGDWGTQ
ncbi:MAG TPA: DUF2933 domain-containing protein [Longimicrobiaceae bacterium]|nr:DUF2933 domain-containing protein [Longimicrobiaceae bacterium]